MRGVTWGRFAVAGATALTVAAAGMASASQHPHEAAAPLGSLADIASMVHADQSWATGVTGAGVDVALIDTGIAPVQGLDGAGKVVNGPDLSFESQAPNVAHLDTAGHGTHMAGIIAGNDGAGASGFRGIAPDSRLVSVKVGTATGAADVSQLIAAVNWVVEHRHDNGLNIRVLNLSFGTDSTQAVDLDPLAYAADSARAAGIVVVAAVGNDGRSDKEVADPARDPNIIAVGASDAAGTTGTRDDTVAAFSSLGGGHRNPDLVAPGTHVQSLRVPGSAIDASFPDARVGDRFFLGSGTSQATAVVSGAAALLLQQRPNLTPGQVKNLLTSTAAKIKTGDPHRVGAGELDVTAAEAAQTPTSRGSQALSGTGSLEAARGAVHVIDPDGAALTGEQDIFDQPWDGQRWAAGTAAQRTWTGGVWNGATWSGATWSGATWSGATWSGATWSGATWSGATWSGATWSGATWSGATWSGATWSGATWSGATWSGATWSGATWSGATWSGATWS